MKIAGTREIRRGDSSPEIRLPQPISAHHFGGPPIFTYPADLVILPTQQHSHEYISLHRNTHVSSTLNHWRFCISQSNSLPNMQFVLRPNTIIIITRSAKGCYCTTRGVSLYLFFFFWSVSVRLLQPLKSVGRCCAMRVLIRAFSL